MRPLYAVAFVAAVFVVQAVAQIPKDLHEWGAFDKAISDDKMWKARWSVNFFDPRVFDWLYYLTKHPVLKETGVNNYHLAKLHWVNVGIREGWQASPNFSPFMYLKLNKDVRDMFGKDNYPYAIMHYLTVGVHETYRPTGGPERINIYDSRIFEWKWYVEHNHLAASGITTEPLAQAHWKAVGLVAGLQASPNMNLAVYLRNNTDLHVKYGDDNFRAALSHWLDQGYRETWRPNGGQTCTFWSTWCLEQHPTIQHWAKVAPVYPQYNASGSGVQSPPIPTDGGWTIRVNGRECEDLAKVLEKPKDSSRIAEIRHFQWRHYKTQRECNVFIRHFVDIQTTVQDREPMSLALFHWTFNDSVPEIAVQQPLSNIPTEYLYKGWMYGRHTPKEPNRNATFAEFVQPSDLMYNISNVIMEVPWGGTSADHIPMAPQYLYDVVHVYRMKPHAQIDDSTQKNFDGTVGVSESDLEETAQGPSSTNRTLDPALFIPLTKLEEQQKQLEKAQKAAGNATTNSSKLSTEEAAMDTVANLTDSQALLLNLTQLANAHKSGTEPEEPAAVRKEAKEPPANKTATVAPVAPPKVVPMPPGKHHSRWATPFNSPYVKRRADGKLRVVQSP